MSLSDDEILTDLRTIRQTVVQDIPPAMNIGDDVGGYFSVMRLIFCYIDLFGYLYKGKDGSESAVNFIKDYMGFELKRYSEVPGLLYTIYRHGTVHIFKPKGFVINGHRYANIIGKDTDIIPKTDNMDFTFQKRFRYTHLEPKKIEPDNPRKDMAQNLEYWLPCSIPRLYQDFLNGIDHFINDVENDNALRKKVGKVVEIYRTPYEYIIITEKSKNVVKEINPDGKPIPRPFINNGELKKLNKF